jgi:hypothetical protein
MIGCYLITDGKTKKAAISTELLTELAKSLRNNGKEMVHFPNESIEVEGIFIPAKDSTYSLMVMSDEIE